MKLTGKCKDDFEKWYQLTDFKCKTQPDISWFYRLSKSMQYGVYVDFFDSVGIVIEQTFGENINRNKYYGYTFWEEMETDEYGFSWFIKTEFENAITRQEARTKAIEKANEIYNESK